MPFPRSQTEGKFSFLQGYNRKNVERNSGHLSREERSDIGDWSIHTLLLWGLTNVGDPISHSTLVHGREKSQEINIPREQPLANDERAGVWPSVIHPEPAQSHLTSEAKWGWTRLVLGWETVGV